MLRKILVVEDSSVVQQMHRVFLARYRGARLVTAHDGAEALARLAEEPEIDLILLDINMPVMNGLELLERMKKDPAYKAIPTIIITTDGGQADAERCLRMGAQGYLTKPFSTQKLCKLIEDATGEKPA
jgi:two-component system chemotaxis response regulator CheY